MDQEALWARLHTCFWCGGTCGSILYLRQKTFDLPLHRFHHVLEQGNMCNEVICVTGRCNLRIIASLTLWQSPSHAKAIALSWWQLHASWPTWQPECDDHHGWHESETNNIWRPPSQCLLFPIYMNGSWCTYISAISYGCWWLVAMLD